MTVVGLVVEGTNDYPIFEAFLEAELCDKYPRPIRIRHLQPEADATSGLYRGGGWGRVVGWCKAYSGEKIETFFNSIEEGDSPCDLIFVQLDGDAVNECAAHSSLDPLPNDCAPIDRVNALTSMTGAWLNLTPERADQVRFAFPVMHSEAWLMAVFEPGENWELVDNSKSPFRALKPAHPKTTVAIFYKVKSDEAARCSDLIESGSQSFSSFRAEMKR